MRGRTGYYGAEHVARIELIRELQADGFNLELIRRLFDSAGSSAAAVRFTRALRAPFREEAPEVVTEEELAERWGAADPKLLRRAEELGLMRPLGEGRWEEVSPRLARVERRAGRAGDLGPPGARGGRRSCAATPTASPAPTCGCSPRRCGSRSRTAGRPAERWPEVSDALERLRPLASESLLAVFRLAMDDEAERAFGRQLERFPLPRGPAAVTGDMDRCNNDRWRIPSAAARSPSTATA